MRATRSAPTSRKPLTRCLKKERAPPKVWMSAWKKPWPNWVLAGARFQTFITHQEDPEGFIRVGGRAVAIRADGVDRAQFHFSPNPGEPPRPLSRVASGGELSRLMLSLGIRPETRRLNPHPHFR